MNASTPPESPPPFRELEPFNWPLHTTIALICFSVVGIAIGTEFTLGWVGLAIAFGLTFFLGFKNPMFFFPIIAGVFLRTGFALMQAWMFILPDGRADALRFHSHGMEAIAIPLGTWFTSIPTGSSLYPHLLGLLYKPLGPSMLLGLSLNVLLGVLIVWLLGATATRLWGEKTGIRTAWIAALFPTLVLYSAVLLRENLIIFGLAAAALASVIAIQRQSVPIAALALGAVYFAGMWNKGAWAALPVPVLLIVWLLVEKIRKRAGLEWTRPLQVAGGTFLLAIAGITVYWGLTMTGLSAAGFDAISTNMAARTDGRTSYPDFLVPDRPIDLLWALPARMLYFLFTPFPWMVEAVIDVIGVLDMLLYVVLVAGLWRSRNHLKGKPQVIWIALLLLAIWVAFALATSNVGTAVRHRTKLLPMLLLLVPLLPFYHKMDAVIEAVEAKMERFRLKGKRPDESNEDPVSS